MEETKENLNLQIKGNIVSKNDEEETKQILELLHSQRKKWRLHNNIALCYFFNVNDNEKVIYDAFQIMHYTLCYSNKNLIN
jgi:hypothetical protein